MSFLGLLAVSCSNCAAHLCFRPVLERLRGRRFCSAFVIWAQPVYEATRFWLLVQAAAGCRQPPGEGEWHVFWDRQHMSG